MPRNWKMINIAIEQVEYIEKMIGNSKVRAKYGFRSVPDFISQAIADKIKQIETEIEF